MCQSSSAEDECDVCDGIQGLLQGFFTRFNNNYYPTIVERHNQ